MKKNLILLVFLALQSASCMAQDNASIKRFLNDFKVFADTISQVEIPTEAQKQVWKVQYSKISDEYSQKYKSVMTDDQVEEYYTYRSQYFKRMGRENLKEAGAVIDSTSVKVGKAVKRGAKKVSGAIKGLFNKKK